MTGFVFNRTGPPPEHPAISVICLNKDHGPYIEDTILSVLGQKFDDFEFIIADGGSTDNSLEVIAKYPFIRLLPGGDGSRPEGILRATAAARGRYIMFTTSTDGYLSRNWFSSVAALLDREPDVSLVFGASAAMSEDGTLGGITYPGSALTSAPEREQMASLWLTHGLGRAYLPELNYCMRLNVFRALVGESGDFPALNGIDPILRVHFEFHRLGFLAASLPILANFGRTHAEQDQFSEKNQRYLALYNDLWQRYRDDVLAGRRVHVLRNGTGQPFVRFNVDSPTAG